MQSPIERLIHWAQVQPDVPAWMDAYTRVGYAALLRGVQARAAWLYRAGVRPGDTVALGLDKTGMSPVRQVEVLYAIAYLGATILPLYPEVSHDRRGPLSDLMGARWLISVPLRDYNSRAQLIDPATDHSDAAHTTPPRGDHPDRPFLYEFTSGTTGNPKAMCATGTQYTAMRMSAAPLWGWRSDDVMMPAVPWPSKVGIRGLVRALLLGATFANFPFPETRLELSTLVDRFKVTFIDSSPWQLRRLLASQTSSGHCIPLRLLGSIGAFVAPSDIRATRETLVANFHVGYGTTEIGLMGHLLPDDPPDAPLRIVPGMEGQALDDGGLPLPAGQVGRLRFRAPWIPTAYANGELLQHEGFHDGWFVTSDMGSVDAQGRITLLGRTDEAINCGGTKIQPQEVEQVLATHPDVADAAVAGIPDAMAGEIAVAFLVLRRPIAMDAMLAYLTPRLEPHQIPAAIAGVESIPRNPEGKILREPLRALYAQLQAKA